MKLHRDFETRSVIDLKKTGAHVYMRHPTTSVWCASYAVDDEPVKIWVPGDPVPIEFEEAAVWGWETWAHNCAFEQMVERHIMAPRHGFPEFDLKQQRCTMAAGYSMSLPGSLEMIAPALGIEMGKDMTGRRLMLQMAKPRKVVYAGKKWRAIPFDAVRVQEMDSEGWEVYATPDGEEIANVRWWNAPDKIIRLNNYCGRDTEVEREVEKRLRPMKPSELDLWHLDQKINQRGILVDTKFCEAAKSIVVREKERLNTECREITDKDVSALSNRNQLLKWVRERGLLVTSLAKDVLEDVLEMDLTERLRGQDENLFSYEAADMELLLLAADNGTPEERAEQIHRILDLRRQAARASVSKIDALLNGADPDDMRIRELLQFHSASTGRWGGRRFQPQNLKRPDEADIPTLIDVVRTGDYEMLSMMYSDPMSAVADTLRGMLIAAPGKKIVAADYSNIEGRVLAWLAGEDWKIQAFRDFDEGKGHDLYKITAGGILHKDPADVTKEERQSHGKVPELALGYQGGYGAFVTMGAAYGVDLPEEQVIGIRDGWREKHPATKALWGEMEDAAISAVTNPGSTTYAANGKIVFRVAGSFLAMRLPSGKFLYYPYPEIRWVKAPWTKKVEVGEEIDPETGEIEILYEEKPVYREALTYFSTIDQAKRGKIIPDDKNTSTWARISTYGGMLTENAVQATSRDLLAYAMPKLEAAGYPIILTVHDEIVSEPDADFGSAVEMEEIMCDLPDWAEGLPVAAEGFEGERYRK